MIYAQGATVKLVTASLILVVDRFGITVSMTKVLTSSIVCVMAGEQSKLQHSIVRNWLIA